MAHTSKNVFSPMDSWLSRGAGVKYGKKYRLHLGVPTSRQPAEVLHFSALSLISSNDFKPDLGCEDLS